MLRHACLGLRIAVGSEDHNPRLRFGSRTHGTDSCSLVYGRSHKSIKPLNFLRPPFLSAVVVQIKFASVRDSVVPAEQRGANGETQS